MESGRLNLLSLKDWRTCFDSVTKTPAWRYLSVVSWAIGMSGVVAYIWATSGHLAALPEEAAGSMSAGFFVVFAVAGALYVCWMGATAVVHVLASVFLMLTAKRDLDVTDELADLLKLPHEFADGYRFAGGPVDCSITVQCVECGHVMCPGCGDQFRVEFRDMEASVLCMSHGVGPATATSIGPADKHTVRAQFVKEHEAPVSSGGC